MAVGMPRHGGRPRGADRVLGDLVGRSELSSGRGRGVIVVIVAVAHWPRPRAPLRLVIAGPHDCVRI